MVAAEKQANPTVVNNLFHLCFVIESSLKFGIKGTKPLSLFSQSSKKTMFSSLSNPVALSYLEESDTVLTQARVSFLRKLCTEAVRSLPDFVPGADVKNLELEYEREARAWVAASFEAANINVGWGETDELRRHVIVALYERGFDAVAEKEALGTADRDKLAMSLLVVAGRRIGGLAR